MIKNQLYQAVFISDLHLHPELPLISQRFYEFINWSAHNTKQLYILGDFFHAWPGDDSLDNWSNAIAQALANLSLQAVEVFFMPGNRDFLLGHKFAKLANMTILPDPTLICLGQQQVLLAHGDSFCSDDKSHQRFRRLTRNRCFINLFLCLPYKLRSKLVQKVRTHSQMSHKSLEIMTVNRDTLLTTMQRFLVQTVIHGHTHQPGCTDYQHQETPFKQYILSDWDDIPYALCYHNTKGLEFIQPIQF